MSEKEAKSIEITSAKKLTGEILESIQMQFGKDKEIMQVIDPEMVGGVKIKVGDKIYNMSLSAQIDEIRRNLIKAIEEGGDEVISPLKESIKESKIGAQVDEIGEVISVKDGIALLAGLNSCRSQEILLFPGDVKGLALNLEERTIGAILLGDYTQIKQGDTVKRTGKIMSMPVSEKMLGRVINPLGETIDGGTPIEADKEYPLERIAPGVMTREPVGTPLQTGIKAIDALIPVGRGQRELILGDRQTGKTALAIDTIINQKGKDVLCIYVAIGQKESKVARLKGILEQRGAMEYTTIVNASASQPAPLLYLAPYSGVTLAEYFADKGKDVLIVYDDLSKQAVAYREMSLLLRRPPGREAYPGDVFYLHSRLLERACNLNDDNGGGSITALPIIETQGGDNTAYIPTNVISITDGQIYLESDLFFKGIRPAVNVGASVSRVGGAAQLKPMKKVAGSIKLALAQFRDLEAFAQFSSDLDPETKRQLDNGRRITELLKQKQYDPLSVTEQVAVIYAVSNGFFDNVDFNDLTTAETQLRKYMTTVQADLAKKIDGGDWSEETEEALKKACGEFRDQFLDADKETKEEK